MGDMSLPPDYPTIPASVYDEAKLVKLARQIAMGIKDLPDILFDNSLTLREFEVVKTHPLFCRALAGEVKAWEGASNTVERVKVKAASMLEEYLPEMYARLNDVKEPLIAKMKAIEVITKLAGMGGSEAQAAGSPGDKVHVIINLGADVKLQYEKQLPPKVIEHEPTQQTFEESIDVSPYPV